MKKVLLSIITLIIATSLLLAALGCAKPAAEVYPSRGIDLVQCYAAGGGTERMARILAGSAGPFTNVSIKAVAMPGAGGAEGGRFVKAAKPDGYTIILFTSGSGLMTPMFSDLGYTMFDFDPICGVCDAGLNIVVAPNSPFNTLKDIVTYAKANPGKLTYGSAGVGGTTYCCMEVFMNQAGIHGMIKYVPFNGTADAQVACMGGHIDIVSSSLQSSTTQINSGLLKCLAVFSGTREKALPKIPTIVESGYPEVPVRGWQGVFAPKGTPKDRIKYLDELFSKILADPGAINLIELIGNTVTYVPSDTFMQSIAKQNELLSAVVKSLKEEPAKK